MAMSTFQKVTLATCLVLCVALLLPKMLLSGGRKDAAEGSGRFPSMMQRQAAPEGRGQRAAGSRAHGTEAVGRAKGAGTGVGTGGKSNLAGQIIPVYGFGILLYILYILFKITNKGNNNKPSESRFPSVRSENTKRKISDFELAQLQDKLRETELVMENIVSNVNHSPDRVEGVTADQEESLLQQLTEITRVMQEGQMVDDVAPEKKSREDWEDDPEEPQQQWERSGCCCRRGDHRHGPETERTRADGEGEEGGGGGEGGEGGEGGGGGGGGGGEEEGGGEGEASSDGAEDPGEERESVGPEGGDGADGADGAGVPEDGVPEDGFAGVLEELELTLKVTSAMERVKLEDLSRATETEASCGAVRRRNNKRRRAKRAAH